VEQSVVPRKKIFKGFNIGKLKVGLPIVQGGMGVGLSLAQLAGSVAREGGIGVIAATGIGAGEPDFRKNPVQAHIGKLKREIGEAKRISSGIIGINVMMVSNDSFELMEVAKEEEADIIFMGAGLPVKIPAGFFAAAARGIPALVPIVSSAKAARFILSYWEKEYSRIPDAFVVEGPLAGGHLGFKKEVLLYNQPKLEDIVRNVKVEVLNYEKKYGTHIPVIAAGGVFSGADIGRILESGADAVQMATRFAATEECEASDCFKNAYVRCRKEDILIIDSPVGMPGRAIRSPFLDDVSRNMIKPFECVWHCIKTCDVKTAPYCIADCMIKAKAGNFDAGFAFCGAYAYRVDRIVKVKTLIDTLKREYERA
jgi:NAD(P)H-dependent flavin oxidoreductase YrpB (nitropropane dioxygenase family)